MMNKKIIALFLRGSSMGSKFLLIIGLSKVLTTEDYGVFSLIVTTLTFLVFFLGIDFYNFSHREIIDNNDYKVKYMVNQFWFHLFCYLIYIPIIYFIFRSDIISLEYFIPFYFLLVFEHFGQELFRLFNLFNKPNQANFILLIRTALWIVVMIAVEYGLKHRELTITNILYYWIGGSILAILYGFLYLVVRKEINEKIHFFSVDKKWITTGIKISIPFFLGTIAYKVIEYSDRYMIDWFLGKKEVGIYSFYTNFANVVNIVISTTIITLIVPDLLRVIRSEHTENIKIKIAQFSKELYITTGIVSLLICVLIFPVLNWINKIEFSKEIIILFIILVGNILFNISLVYHYLLYAYKKDKFILMPTLYASIVNIVLNFIFIPKFGLSAAALSTLLSFGLIMVLKRKYWLKVKDIEF